MTSPFSTPLARRAFALVLLPVTLMSAREGVCQALMEGHYGVSAGGAATYDIPIVLPPAIQGVAPNLHLSYSSRDGNQIAGVGFSIGGLSTITRCPQTRYQDNAVTTINYTSSDRFCLDGKRLMLKSGTYGANAAEYRTEVDEISKVVSTGSLGTAPLAGPASFTVYKQNGDIYEYGLTTDGQVLAATRNVVRVWALNRVRDRKGNYFTVTYTQDRGNGQFYPAQIKYTGNLTTGFAPQASVVFDYESRPDAIEKYFSGDVVRSTVRLKTIHTKIASQTPDVLTYSLSYGTSPSSNFSRLTSVTECAGATCLPPTVIGWDNSGVSTNSYVVNRAITRSGPSSTVYDGTNAGVGRVSADVNGDGLDDIVNVGLGTYINNVNHTYTYYPWTGDALVTDNGNGKGTLWGVYTADMDGDGKQDVVVVWGEGVLTDTPKSGPQYFNIDVYFNVDGMGKYRRAKWLSNSNLSNSIPQSSSAPWFRILGPADVDGDGRPDFVIAENVNNDCDSCVPNKLTLWLFRNTGSGFNFITQDLPPEDFAHTQMFLTDINGDGRADLLIGRNFNTDPIAMAGVASYVSTGTSFTAGPGLSGSFTANYDSDSYYVADLNGDGYPDLVRVYRTGVAGLGYGNIELALNTGTSFKATTWSIANLPTIAWPVTFEVRDSNGDGRSDLVNPYQSSSGQGIYVFRSTGTSFVAEPWAVNTTHLANDSWISDELDGQGTGGVVHAFPDLGTLSIDNYKSSLISRDRVVSVSTSGVSGFNVGFDYQTLPNLLGSQYWKDVAGAFPVVAMVPPTTVVSKVTTPDGHQTRRTLTYSYGTLLYEEGGRGSLGFNRQRVFDSATGLSTDTYFRQPFPYTGLVDKVLKYSGTPPAGLYSSSVNVYSCIDSASSSCAVVAGKSYLPYVGETDDLNWDLNSTALPGLKTVVVSNAYGFPSSVTKTVLTPAGAASGFSETKTWTYGDDVANWLLGRHVQEVVTRTAP